MTSRNELLVTSGVVHRSLPWVVGAVIYLGMLAMLGLGVALELRNSWTALLTGRITVVVPVNVTIGSDGVELNPVASLEKVETVIAGLENVETTNLLPDTIAQQLIQPWLGEAAKLETLPLPRLFEVTFSSRTTGAVETLRTALAALSGEIRVDDHQLWRQQLLGMASTVAMVALTVVILVFVIAVVLVVLSVRGALLTNYATFEILNLMGYPDEALLSHYARWAKQTGQYGAMFALLLLLLSTVALLLNNIVAVQAMAEWIVAHPLILPMPLLAPVSVYLMITVTTRITVRYWLRRIR